MADADPTAACDTANFTVGAPPFGYKASGKLCGGIRQGKWTFRALDGDGVIREGVYIDGNETGLWRTYYRSGWVESEGTYVAGRHVGTWIWWHENGATMAQGTYDDGLRHGVWQRWHAEGGLAVDRRYIQGKREGPVLTYDKDGLLVHVRVCASDRCVTRCQARPPKVCPPPPGSEPLPVP
jgi:hypothetical protein